MEQLDATKGEDVQPDFARCRKSLTKCTARKERAHSAAAAIPICTSVPSHPTSQVPTARERGDREREEEGRGLHKDAQSIFILGQTQFSFCALAPSRGPQTLRVPVSVGGGVDSAFGDLRIDSEHTILEDGESH